MPLKDIPSSPIKSVRSPPHSSSAMLQVKRTVSADNKHSSPARHTQSLLRTNPAASSPNQIIKLKSGLKVDISKVEDMKKRMIGRAKTIDGDETQIYFPPVCLQACKPLVSPSKPKAGVFQRNKNIGKTEFSRHYDRGDLPLYVTPDGVSRKLHWKMKFENMDYAYYLPIFFHGVREKQEPHKFIARQGLMEMLDNDISKVIDVIPNLVIPIKEALATKDVEVMSEMLKTIQKLLFMGGSVVGAAFVPYYRQILPVFRLFYNKNVNIGDKIYYTQFKRVNMGDLIIETLELFERLGGPHAFINIKYMIPTYESVLNQKA